jgi:hypothetical protein
MLIPSARNVAIGCAVSILLGAQPGYGKEQITVTRKDSRQHPAKPDTCEIDVFQETGTKPQRPYDEVAIVNYHDERHRSKDGSLKLYVVLPILKTRACRLGADALVDIRVTEVRRLEFVMFNVRTTAVHYNTDAPSTPSTDGASADAGTGAGAGQTQVPEN